MDVKYLRCMEQFNIRQIHTDLSGTFSDHAFIAAEKNIHTQFVLRLTACPDDLCRRIVAAECIYDYFHDVYLRSIRSANNSLFSFLLAILRFERLYFRQPL